MKPHQKLMWMFKISWRNYVQPVLSMYHKINHSNDKCYDYKTIITEWTTRSQMNSLRALVEFPHWLLCNSPCGDVILTPAKWHYQGEQICYFMASLQFIDPGDYVNIFVDVMIFFCTPKNLCDLCGCDNIWQYVLTQSWQSVPMSCVNRVTYCHGHGQVLN